MDYYSVEMKAAQTTTAAMMVRLMDCLLAASLVEKMAEMLVRMTDCLSDASLAVRMEVRLGCAALSGFSSPTLA